MSSNTLPTSHQFSFDGIHEFDFNSDKPGQYRKKLLDHDYHSLSDILDFISESPTIVDLRGSGTFRHQPFGRQHGVGHMGDKSVDQMG